MKWVTRKKAMVDRIACPWLITKFIDEDPTFYFVDPENVLSFAKDNGAIPFDVKGAKLYHYIENGEERVSFDAIIKEYNIKDPALLKLAEIVRGADANIPNPPPESAGLKAIASGFRMISKDDYENMKLQFPVYDALYKYCEMKLNE